MVDIIECCEWAAKQHDEWAEHCRIIAATTRKEWTGPEYSDEDRKANLADARVYDKKASYHDQSARQFRALASSLPRTPQENASE